MLLLAGSAWGTGRYGYVLTDTSGNALTGVELKLYRVSDDALLGTFTEVGDGVYYIDYGAAIPVYLKADGVTLTETDGMIFLADNVAIKDTLASTAANQGASDVGIYDLGSYYSSTTVEGALLELGPATRLDNTGASSGAYLVAVTDAGGYYSGATVEAVLAELGSMFDALGSVTATAAELNRLDGVSDSVTAGNLNDLVDPTSTTDLHRHDLTTLSLNKVGPSLQSQDATPVHFYVYSGYDGEWNGDGPMGNIYLTTYNVNGSGRVYVREGNDSEVQTDYEVVTTRKAGSLNWSGSSYLNGCTDLTSVDLRLASGFVALQQAVYSAGMTSTVIYSSGTADSSCSLPDTTVRWATSSGTEDYYLRQAFVCEPGMKSLTAIVSARNKDNDDGKLGLTCGSYSDTEGISDSTWGYYTLSCALPDVTSDSVMTVGLYANISDTEEIYISHWINIRASQ